MKVKINILNMEIIPKLDRRIFKPLTEIVALLPHEHLIMVYFDLIRTIFENNSNKKSFYDYIETFAENIDILKDKFHLFL